MDNLDPFLLGERFFSVLPTGKHIKNSVLYMQIKKAITCIPLSGEYKTYQVEALG
jgi:hypothetical protein